MIKKIEKIPDDPRSKNTSRAQQLRNDLIEAYEHDVPQFELTGYGDWKYLQNYARQEMTWQLNRIFTPLIRATWKEKHPESHSIPLLSFKIGKDDIHITSRKIDGQKHVYCSLDYTRQNEDQMLENYMKQAEAALVEQEERKKKADEIHRTHSKHE